MTGSNIETEYLELTAKSEWPDLFKQIREQSSSTDNTCLEAVKPQNKVLNRYRDVNPYDDSRIILHRGATDYINANLVKVEKADRRYILTQGPLLNTVHHFWLMVWEQQSKAVLMLNKLVENRQEKCCQYWPTKIGAEHAMKMDDIKLTLEYVEKHDYSYFLTRTLRLTDLETNGTLDVIQFHYTTWPDFGVPSSPNAFLQFLQQVRTAGVLESDVGPAIIHCSAGIGRSGTFCLVDSCLVLIKKFGINSVDVKEILLGMRQYRMGLIQTAEQLRFSYQAIIQGAKQLLNSSNTQLAEATEVNHTEGNSDCKQWHSSSSEDEGNNDDDEPPPLPPPRGASLMRQNNSMPSRPLPKIPNSASLNDVCTNGDSAENEVYHQGDLPVVPGDEGSSEDELIDEDDKDSLSDSDHSRENNTNNVSLSPSDVRHRQRVEKKEQMEAKVREMKRRQQANEQWIQLKRSLYKPLIITSSLILGASVFAYYYFKS